MSPYDRLDLLDTFVKIAQTRSITRAARLLGLTKPPVTRRLNELEEMLGCKLAVRTPKSFALTPQGERLLHEARELTEHWVGLSDILNGRSDAPEGVLRVIAPARAGLPWITDAATDLIAQFPALQVEISEADWVHDLATSGAECWVLVGALPDAIRTCHTIGAMEVSLVGTPALLEKAGPVTFDSLSRVPFVGMLPYVKETVRLVHPSGRSHTVRLQSPLSTASLGASYRAVLNGAGVGPAARWMAFADIQAGNLVEILPGWSLEPLEIHVALPSGGHYPARVRAFVDSLRARMGDQPGIVPAPA